MRSPRWSRSGTLLACLAFVVVTGVGAVALEVDATPAGATRALATDPSWTRGVCSGVLGWLGAVRGAATKAAGPGGDPTKTRKTLDAMLRSSDAATAKLVTQLRAAGTPTSAGGKQLGPIAREQFTRVRQVIATARTAVAAAPTGDPAAFARAVVLAQGGLESALEAVQAALGAATLADVEPLLGVFTASDRCRSSVAPSSGGGITVTPAVVAPGRDVSIAPAGVDAAAAAVCTQSSAFKTELLDPDGARVAIGARAISVPVDAKAGAATIRLVCYLPDSAGRRVIRGLCAGLTIGTGSAPAATAACPATPRLVLAQSVISVESALSEGFNRLAT